MRWGLIVRSETDRGLGIQTQAMYENLKPDKTLLVLVPKSGFMSHPELYPDAEQVTLKIAHGFGVLDEETVRDWWKDLDVVVSVETLYDWRLVEWAEQDGVKTLIHGNPEFWMSTNPQPTAWMWPTSWRLEHLPKGPIVPVPVPDDVKQTAATPGEGDLRIVHIGGNAMADRNGTLDVINAMRKIPTGVRLDIFAQSAVPKTSHMRIKVLKPVADRWAIYRDRHALLIPRKYGGLCLPVQEAMASGLAVIMTDCQPNPKTWPIIPMITDLGKIVRMQTGGVQLHDCPPNVIANTLKHCATVPKVIETYQQKGLEWAAAHTWSTLKQRYYDEIDKVNSI